MRDIEHVPQVESADCAAAALASTARFFGVAVTLSELRLATDTGRDGTSLLHMATAARALGLSATGVRVDPSRAGSLPGGTIVQTRGAHFVVLGFATKGPRRRVVDPARGLLWLTAEELNELCSGAALQIEGTTAARGARRRLTKVELGRARSLLKLGRADKARIAASLILGVLLQVLALLTPIVIGLVLAGHAKSNLPAFTILLAATTPVVAAATIWGRGRVIATLRHNTDRKVSFAFVNHLTKLPLPFFMARTPGYMLAQVNGTAALRDAASTLAATTLLDGLTASLSMIAIFIYSPRFGGLVLLMAIVLLLIGRWLSRDYESLVAASQSARSETQNDVMGLMFNVEQIKAQGSEDLVLKSYSEHYQVELDRLDVLGRRTISTTLAADTFRIAMPIIIIAIALQSGSSALATAIPVAFASAGLMVPLSSMLGTSLQLKAARVHLLRLQDVMAEPVDTTLALPALKVSRPPDMSVSNLTFRYAGTRQPALQEVSLHLPAGSVTVFIGNSGSGKSTLIKLLIGMLMPNEGVVSIDGNDLAAFSSTSYRKQIGVVTQDAALASATLKEVILLGRSYEASQMDAALAASGALEFVSRLPLGLETPVQDRGSAFSGGQRQRIALARAMYGRPAILVLDEATNQLDPATELHVLDELRKLGATTLVVSHRPAALTAADTVVRLRHGRVVDVGPHSALRETASYADYWRG